MWYLKKQGKRDQTVTSQVKLIKQLIKLGADLENPENIKMIISSQQWVEGRKRNFVHAYTNYLRMQNKTWEAPNYESVPKIPFVPLETEVDQLISGCVIRHATFLQFLKETGARRCEAFYLRWDSLDFETREVRITPEKGSNPRKLRMSDKLIVMINKLPRRNEYVFGGGNVEDFSNSFRNQRARIAFTTGNERIKQINFKSLRHYKGTTEYIRTGNIYYVKKILGHKMIKNTEIYMQTAGDPSTAECITNVATTGEEARKLIETGFDYVFTTPDALMIFKKRK